MATDKIRKYVLPNIPYLFIGWFCLKIGTAYRLAAGAGFGEKLLGLGQTIGAAFGSFAPGLAPLDWLVGIVGAAGFRLLIYYKAKKAKKFRRDAEYGTARWGNEKDIKPFVDPKFENNMLLTATERLTMNTRPKNPANARNLNFCGIGSSGSGKTRFWLTPQLLMCERLPNDDVLKPDKVEDIVKTAITYADESPERAYHVKSKWIVFYGFSLLICCIGTFLNYTTAQPCMETLETLALLSAVFGAYFCCFVRTKLSSFYDENSVNIFYDGPFRMNVPGVKFNNRNWPHIVRTLRLSLCLCMILFPIINIVAGSIVADVWENIGKYVFLAMFLCGVLLPIYVVGKKYE